VIVRVLGALASAPCGGETPTTGRRPGTPGQTPGRPASRRSRGHARSISQQVRRSSPPHLHMLHLVCTSRYRYPQQLPQAFTPPSVCPGCRPPSLRCTHTSLATPRCTPRHCTLQAARRTPHATRHTPHATRRTPHAAPHTAEGRRKDGRLVYSTCSLNPLRGCDRGAPGFSYVSCHNFAH
jgi:hypothetical protein